MTSNGQTYEINGSDIGLTAVAEDTAKKAFDYCKSDSTFKNALAAIELMFKPHIIVPAVQVDTEQLDAKLNEFGNIALGERKQHYVEFNDDGTLTIYSGKTGYNLDPSTAEQEVITALSNEIFNNIAVTFTSAPPDEMTVESLDALVYKDPDVISKQNPFVLFKMIDDLEDDTEDDYTGNDPYLKMFYGM